MNLSHQAEINNQVLEAIIAVIVAADSYSVPEIAKELVKAIARKQIPHVDIKY
jgi:hypothetical protein